MGYKIVYAEEPKKHKLRGKKWIASIAVLLGLIAVKWFGWDEQIRQWLLPGDPEVTAMALENMAKLLSDGTSAEQAWTAFCREIIAGAQIG